MANEVTMFSTLENLTFTIEKLTKGYVLTEYDNLERAGSTEAVIEIVDLCKPLNTLVAEHILNSLKGNVNKNKLKIELQISINS